jgi:Spy/CpxP family protein refolding chaperone
MRKREIIAEKRMLLRDLVGSPEIDREGVRAAITELGQQQAVLDSLVAETVLQELEVLSPDQRERYLEMLALEGSGRGGLRGRGSRGGRRQ